MQYRNSKELFALVEGMSKYEKRSFNLYARRHTDDHNLKVLKVYNAMNSLARYDEQLLVRKLKALPAGQLPNLKISLYNLVLDSLRSARKPESIELQLHKLMDHAKIFCDKSLYISALKALVRVKALALKYHQISFAFQAVVIEKKIELINGPCETGRIEALNRQLQTHSEQLSLIGQLSNISMILYGWYRQYGQVCSEAQEKRIDVIFHACFKLDEGSLSFYPTLYLAQARTYYFLSKGDSLRSIQAANSWVEQFQMHPEMKEIEKLQYQRGLVYLSESSQLGSEPGVNFITQECLKEVDDSFYNLLLRINLSQLENTLDKELINETERTLKDLQNPKRVIVLCYKAAVLCLGSRYFEKAIDFTQIGIQGNSSSRLDLQYKLRHLQIEAHEKLKNFEIIDHLKISARRFGRGRGLEISDKISI